MVWEQADNNCDSGITQFETCAWVFCDGYDYEHRDVIQQMAARLQWYQGSLLFNDLQAIFC